MPYFSVSTHDGQSCTNCSQSTWSMRAVLKILAFPHKVISLVWWLLWGLHQFIVSALLSMCLVNGTRTIVKQHVGQHCLHLQHSKLLAYAVSGTSAEVDVGIGVSLCYPLWQEVVRVKLLTVGEVIRVPMDVIDLHCQCYCSRYGVIIWNTK